MSKGRKGKKPKGKGGQPPEPKFVHIEFRNIKKMSIYFNHRLHKAKLLIQLTDPCRCKDGKEMVKSFFNLEEPYPYLSYWNLN